MLVTININNQNIKMLAAEKRKIVRWETVQLPPGVVKDGQIIKPEAVAAILNELFENSNLPRAGIIASITGMSFIYRILTLPKLKKAEMPEAILRATQKEINVPVNELYVDWQAISEKEGSLELFVLGAPRSMVDAVTATFKLSNLKLAALDLNSLALARMVDQPKALIADWGGDWFDIVIVAGGLPVTLHSVPPKGDFREFEDNLSQMGDEVRRTVDFFNLTHKEDSIRQDEAVILSGIRRNNPGEREQVGKYIPFAGVSPNGHWTYPEGFTAEDYAVLLGLALKAAENKTFLKTVPEAYKNINLNLLEGQGRTRRNPAATRKLLVPAAIVLAAMAIMPLLLMRNSAASENRNLQSELDRINQALNIRRMSLAESDSSESKIKQYLTDSAAIQNERNLISGPGDLGAQLNVITGGLAGQMRYTGLVSSASQINVDGQAGSRAEVLNYTSYLESQKIFKEVRIAAIEDIGPADDQSGSFSSGEVAFKIILER